MDILDIQRRLDNGGFDLGEQLSGIECGNDVIQSAAIPYIATPKAWDQYTDAALYDAEVKLRAWLTEMGKNPTFKKMRNARTFKFSQVFHILFGRPYDSKKDAKYATKLSRLFRYYCSNTKPYFYDKESGKYQSKTSFVFSLARLKKPPYSIRLRFEWMAERGEVPTAANMRLPEDIEIGRARNPLTEANREKRREAGRQRYNEYQRKLRIEHNEGRAVRSYNRRASSADDTV